MHTFSSLRGRTSPIKATRAGNCIMLCQFVHIAKHSPDRRMQLCGELLQKQTLMETRK